MNLPLMREDGTTISQKDLSYSQKRNLYRKEFGFLPDTLTNKYLLFLGGFVEGEGSITVNVRANVEEKGPMRVDGEFNVTQSLPGVVHLLAFFVYMHTGSIKFKQGSNATYVFYIQSRQTLIEKVVPFYERYVLPYSCEDKVNSFRAWHKTIQLLQEGAHKDNARLRNELLPLVYQVNRQSGKERKFPTLEQAQDYLDSL